MTRAHWGSRLGFILASAGSAIGLGAVWKFPYVTGNNGGGAFLLIYLAISLTLGLALMVAEMALGRSAGEDAVGTFRDLKGGAWPIAGYAAVLTCFLILSFYCTVGGWTVAYFAKAVDGNVLAPEADLATEFGNFIADPKEPLIYLAVFSLITLFIVIGGVREGIEKLSKYFMPVMFVLMLVLIGRSLTLPGALSGLKYFLYPDFSKVGTRMVLDALGLSFFSLSLGAGMMITYGSYVAKEVNLFRSSLWVIALALGMSFLSGLIVLPAVFAFGFDPQSGPGLTFVTMPAVFVQMPGGAFFAVLFFALLVLAALTSSVSLLEVIVCFLIDELKLSRAAAATGTTLLFMVLGVAVSWSFGIWKDVTLFGKTIFECLDFLTVNMLMPCIELSVALFAGWAVWQKVEKELTLNSVNPHWIRFIKFLIRYLAPALIVAILVSGLLPDE